MPVKDYTTYYAEEGKACDHQARMRMDEFHSFLADRIEHTIRACGPRALLDVGCAEGRYVFSYPGLSIGVGVDLSEAKLRRAVDYSSEFDVRSLFVMADAHHLPFPSESFDSVVCSQVLEHLEDPFTAMQELARVAHSHVIISVPVWSLLSPFGFGSPHRSRDYRLQRDGHIQWFTAGKLRRLAHRAGLTTCRIEPIGGRYPLRRLLRHLPGMTNVWLRLDSLIARLGILSPFAYRVLMICRKEPRSQATNTLLD